MLNNQQGDKLTPDDWIGIYANTFNISPADRSAACLCHIYAHVLEDIICTLGAERGQDNRLAINEPESERVIRSMIKALEEILFELENFKEDRNLDGCPEDYKEALYNDIDYLIPKLEPIVPLLVQMANIYDDAKIKCLDDQAYPDPYNRVRAAQGDYKGFLVACRKHIVRVKQRIVQWHNMLPPPDCPYLKAEERCLPTHSL